MDNAADNDTEEATPPLGALLAEGREHHGLSRNDVAQRLHMSPSQVEALENGDYGRLPKGTFLRGFVRNYAKLIGLDPEQVLPLLAEGVPRDPAPRIVVPTQNIRFDPLSERFSSPWMKAAASATVVIAVALAAMYWWVFVRPQPPGQQASSSAVGAPAQSQDSVTPEPASPPPTVAQPPVAPPPAVQPPAAQAPVAQAPVTQPPVTQPPVAEAPGGISVDKVANTTPAKAAAPAPGERRIHFSFKGESWVEVRDASNRVVFRQLNEAGSETTVRGKGPLQVVVGNAHEVVVERDGKPFDLGPVTDTDVARFKVE